MTSKEWFKQAKFGLFIHWGLYSVIGGEWKGKRTAGYGDWAQQVFRIPVKEYEKLATVFNPIYFDAEEWVKLAKNAGMQYLVVTAKHHEGFAMFHSKVDKFNIVDATPFKRDVVKELAEACYKYGLKFGVYYSQEIDWHERNGGGWTRGETASAGNIVKCYWVNNWDFPEDDKKDFSQYFNEKSKLQVKELLTNYGELSILWFDTPHTIKLEQSKELFEMVKKYQPNCLMNSRIGNGMGDFRSMKDNQIPDEFMGDELVECPATLNDTWGYKSFDNNWKDAKKVREIKEHLNARGVNYLLNVGPDALGRIPAPALDILTEVGKR